MPVKRLTELDLCNLWQCFFKKHLSVPEHGMSITTSSLQARRHITSQEGSKKNVRVRTGIMRVLMVIFNATSVLLRGCIFALLLQDGKSLTRLGKQKKNEMRRIFYIAFRPHIIEGIESNCYE